MHTYSVFSFCVNGLFFLMQSSVSEAIVPFLSSLYAYLRLHYWREFSPAYGKTKFSPQRVCCQNSFKALELIHSCFF